MNIHKVRHTALFPAPAYKAVDPVCISKVFDIQHGGTAELDFRAEAFHGVIGMLIKSEK